MAHAAAQHGSNARASEQGPAPRGPHRMCYLCPLDCRPPLPTPVQVPLETASNATAALGPPASALAPIQAEVRGHLSARKAGVAQASAACGERAWRARARRTPARRRAAPPPRPSMAAPLSAGAGELQIAGEDLLGALDRSSATLAAVARRLEEEFAGRFADGVRARLRRRGHARARHAPPPCSAPAQQRLRPCPCPRPQVNPLSIARRIKRLERCAAPV